MVGTFCVTCTMHPWTPTESVNLKTCVVGKDVHVVVVPDVAGFYHGILLERVGIFGDVVVAIDVGKR